MSKGSTSGLKTHIDSFHAETDYAKKFYELAKMKEGGKGEMDKHINIKSSGWF